MRLFFSLVCFVSSIFAYGQTGIGIGTDSPNPSSILEIQSNNKGILIPRISNAERATNLSALGISEEGLLIYNSDDQEFNYWNGSIWVAYPNSAANDLDWSRDGSNGYLYPSNLTDNVGIGTLSPTYPLVINASDKGNGMFVTANFSGSFGTGASAISTSVSGTTSQKVNGINQLISVEGTGARNGILNTFEGAGSGSQIGYSNFVIATGGGQKIGLKNDFDFGSGGTQYGVQTSFLLSGTGSLYGMENNFFSTGNNNHYGIWNNMVTSGAGQQYGAVNAISGGGSGAQTGVYNPVTNDGVAEVRGTYNKVGGNGTGPKYGVKNEIEDIGSDVHFGVYNNIGSSGIGERYGVFNDINNNSANDIFGVRNNISNIGGGTHYGIYSQMTGTGLGDKYGTYILLDINAGGNHYGIYSDVQKSGSYAGYFIGDVYLGTNTTNGYKMPPIDGNAGKVITTDGLGQANWTSRVQKVVYKEIQTSAVTPTSHPGSSWLTRPLNTTEGSASFASLTANQITLQPGDYFIKVIAPISSSLSGEHQTMVYDVTNGATLIEGITSKTNSIGVTETTTIAEGIVNIASSTIIEIQSYSTVSSSLGFQSTVSANHIFTIVEIEKLD